MAKIGLDSIDPATPVSQLGIGQQQMVEIARNLQDDTRILVLDEPTAMLTPRETNYLFEQIAHLTARGVAIIYVSHRLEELRRIADRVAVLRDGRLVDVRPMAGMSEDDLVQRMVGRVVSDLDHRPRRPRRPVGPVVMSAEGLGRGTAMQDVSLELRAGEILALPGWSDRAAPSWFACCLAPTVRTGAASHCTRIVNKNRLQRLMDKRNQLQTI